MPPTHTLKAIEELGPGDHLCCLYQNEAEHRAILTPFLHRGLNHGEKVRYIMDVRTADNILDYLRDAGLDVAPYLADGQLGFLSQADTYLRNGVFDPDVMLDLLEKETALALEQGYTALRVTGEMTWALRGLPGTERLIEYEAKLNQFFPHYACLALCQYDRRHFDANILLDVLRTHPLAVIGEHIYDNAYYIPPADMLSEQRETAELEHWIANLAERERTAQALQHRLDVLTTPDWKAEELRFTDIIDIEQIQTLMDLFYQATGIPVGILDTQGQILVATGWRDICTQFHRAHPGTAKRCQESDAYIQRHLFEGQAVTYKCKNGLWDVAFPILVNEQHLATLFIGQFLYDDEVPDEAHFRAQAEAFGFDISAYLEALRHVYVFSHEQVQDIIAYYSEFVQLLSDLGHKNLALAQDIEVRRQTEAELQRYREKLEELVAERTKELANANLRLRQEVAERERAEAQLRFQAMLLEQIQDSVIATDLEGRITYANQGAAQSLGKTPHDLVGQKIFALGENPDKGATQSDILEQTLQHGAWHGQVVNYREDGSECIFATRTWLMPDDEGNPTGLVGISTDITTQEEAKAALKRYAQKLEIANTELSEYAYVVSHDLRAPLRAIRNYADFIQEDMGTDLKGDLPLYLSGLEKAVEEADELVRDLLEFARIGRDKTPSRTINMGEFLTQLLAKLQLSQEVAIDMPMKWPTITVHPLLLEQIFKNLIDNAVKFNESAQKCVELGWRTLPTATQKYEFFVRDNGIGIAPNYQEQIFRVFERLHTREEYEGTGIGLAIVKKAVAHLDGSIRLESTPGKGSTFFVTLPK